MAEAKKIKLSMNFDIFPTEMIEKILKFLNYKDVYTARLVCRRLKEIIHKGSLRKILPGKN